MQPNLRNINSIKLQFTLINVYTWVDTAQPTASTAVVIVTVNSGC